MRPDQWDELIELLWHAVLACVLILLFAWGVVEVMQ